MSVETLFGLLERSRTGDVLPVVEWVVVGEVSVFHGPPFIARPHGSASDDAANAPEPLVPGKSFSSRKCVSINLESHGSVILPLVLEASFFPFNNPLPIAGFPHIVLDVDQFNVLLPMF